MYFVDVESLKRDLSVSSLSAGEQFKYVIAISLSSLAPHSSAFDGFERWNGLDWLSWGLGWSVFLASVSICYRSNGGSKGIAYVERLLSLGWVVGIRCIPGALVMYLAGFMLIRAMGAEDVGETVAFRVLIPAVGALCAWRLNSHFRSLMRTAG